MITKTALAGLTLAAFALTACGGGSTGGAGSAAPSGDGSSGASPSSVASASSPAMPSEGASASTSGATAAAGAAADPCNVLGADQIKDLTGLEVKKGTSQTVSSSTLCTWLPVDQTSKDAAVVSAQEGALPGDLSQVEDQLKQQFDGDVSPLDVPGADDARYITGKKSGLQIIDVLAQHDGIFYQVLIAAPRDVSEHKGGAIKVVQALIKG